VEGKKEAGYWGKEGFLSISRSMVVLVVLVAIVAIVTVVREAETRRGCKSLEQVIYLGQMRS
jgi:hypothetical protein